MARGTVRISVGVSDDRGGAGPTVIDRRVGESIARLVGSNREARWIVEHADGDGDRALSLASRRAAGEPLQYVLGRWPFRQLELALDQRVLIPRPETEQVVEVALAELAGLVAGDSPPRPGGPGPVAVDLGTGSGAIALSLALEGGVLAPGLAIWATDRSPDALAVAADNCDELARRRPDAADRVRLVEGRWFGALPPTLAGAVDLVVSNPPYVAEADYPGLEPTVRLGNPAAPWSHRIVVGWGAWPTSRRSSSTRLGGYAPGG